jgi:tetratricopeptide (TPR) repeat protein
MPAHRLLVALVLAVIALSRAEGGEQPPAAARPDGGLSRLERERRLRPRDTRVIEQLARAYRQAGRTQRAIDTLREGVVLAPDSATLAHLLGRYLCAARQCTEGLEKLTAARRLLPSSTEIQLDVALAHVTLGEQEQALPLLESLAAGAPGDPKLAFYLAECYAALLDWAHARPFYERALRGLADDADCQFGLGRALVALGQAEAAVGPLQRALALERNSAQAHFQLMRAFQALGRSEDAAREAAAFQRLQARRRASGALPVEAAAQASGPWREAARRLETRGEHAALLYLQSLRGASALDPVAVIGVLQFGRSRYADAERLFGQAAARNPGEENIHFYLGMCRLKVGDLTGAEEAFRAELRVNPTAELALSALGHLKHLQGEWAEAARFFEQSQTTDPVVLLVLSETYFRLGQPREALATADLVRAFASDDAAVLKSLGELLERENRPLPPPPP